MTPADERGGTALAVGAGLVALSLGIWLSPERPADDAAIFLRYAERLATGSGFTYNDHERVLGSSSGLWPLLVAALRAVGVPVVGGVLALAAVTYAAAIAAATHLATRLGGLVAGGVTASVLVTSGGFRGVILSGMESGLAALLGTLALLALTRAPDPTDAAAAPAASRRVELVAGALVGLALLNKLDAVWLLVAVTGAWWWTRRQFPLRLTATAAAVVGPYLIAGTIWFGSPIPQSATSKLGGRADAPGWSWDPTWPVVSLRGLWPALPAVAFGLWWALRSAPCPSPGDDLSGDGGPGDGDGDPSGGTLRPGAPVAWAPLSSGGRTAAVALAGWGVLHGLAVALVPTGAEYPWYLTVLHLPVATFAGLFAAGIWPPNETARLLLTPAGRPGADGRPQRLRAALVVVAVGGLALTVAYPLATAVRADDPSIETDRFDRQVPEVVDWLRPRLAEGEVLRTCFGGAALAFPDNPIDDPCGLASDEAPGPIRFEIAVLTPTRSEPSAEESWSPPTGRCVAFAATADPLRPEAERVIVLAPLAAANTSDPSGRCPSP